MKYVDYFIITTDLMYFFQPLVLFNMIKAALFMAEDKGKCTQTKVIFNCYY